jgi:hypothetical protein
LFLPLSILPNEIFRNGEFALYALCFHIKLIKLKASTAARVILVPLWHRKSISVAKTCAHINNYLRQGNILQAQLLGELLLLTCFGTKRSIGRRFDPISQARIQISL